MKKGLKITFIILIILVLIPLTINYSTKLYKRETSSISTEQLKNMSDDNTTIVKENGVDDMKSISKINLVINGKEFTATLEDNETAREILEMLPLEMNMSELNGNEKYYYLDEALPTNSSVPSRIEKGDVMLYGNNCLVIFYQSFNTSYSYTKIGHITDLPDLSNGNIKIIFSK